MILTGVRKDPQDTAVMAENSFALKLLLCAIFLTLLLWQLEVNDGLFKKPAMKKVQIAQRETSAQNYDASTKNQTKTWLVVYWSTFFGIRLRLQEKWPKGECPVPCELTSNISRAKEADGFVVHARDPRPLPPIQSVPWILQTRENPVYTPVLKDSSYMSRFNLLKGYRLDSDFPDPSVLLPDLTPPIPFKNKTGLIMAALSNCEPVRTEYMRQLMKFVQVDSYGACLKNKPDLVGRYGTDKGINYRDAKSILSRRYKFTLVFFNQDCDYFVDAQLYDAWRAGSVPIVMATDKLDEFLPGPYLNHSVIKVRDFKSPERLADYIKYLSNNETEYNRYLEWKWKGYGDITGTAIGDYWMPKYPLYCQVCVALSEGRAHKNGLKPITCEARRFEDWGIAKGG